MMFVKYYLPSLNTTSGWLGLGACFVSIRRTRGSSLLSSSVSDVAEVGDRRLLSRLFCADDSPSDSLKSVSSLKKINFHYTIIHFSL